MSQEAPKINFAAAQSRCVAIIRSNRGEIMCAVMCACVVHARQVKPYLQESIIYENLTGEVVSIYHFEEYLPLPSSPSGLWSSATFRRLSTFMGASAAHRMLVAQAASVRVALHAADVVRGSWGSMC